MKRVFLTLTIVAAAIMAAGASYAHELPDGFSGFDSPSKCKGCHSVIYKEWEDSMHAKSSKFSDPVHSALHDAFSGAMEANGKTPNYHCANCHTPTADNMKALMKGIDLPDPSNPTNTDGVTCAFCHMVSEVVEGEMFHGYKVTDGIKGGTRNSPAPHGVTYSEFNSSYEMCMGCHGKKVGGKGGVICSMEDEGVTDCLVCHMPSVQGKPASASKRATHAFHGIHGAHDPSMLRQGAEISVGAEGLEMGVGVRNPNTHYFPSTNPLRIAYVKVVAKDASGKTVFENFTDDPMQDRKAVFMKAFKAGEDVGVPSWDAEGVAFDTRLAPGETRWLNYELPEGAASVSVKLFYRFAPPKAVEKFGMPKDGVVDVPHLVDEAEIKL